MVSSFPSALQQLCLWLAEFSRDAAFEMPRGIEPRKNWEGGGWEKSFCKEKVTSKPLQQATFYDLIK